MAQRYKVSRETARADYEELHETIWTIAQAGEEVCPVTHLDVQSHRADERRDLGALPHGPGADLSLPERLPPLLRGPPQGLSRDVHRAVEARHRPLLGTGHPPPDLHRRRGHPAARPGGAGPVRRGRGPGHRPADQRAQARATGPTWTSCCWPGWTTSRSRWRATTRPSTTGWWASRAPGQETVEGIKTVVDADVYMMTNTTMTTENVGRHRGDHRLCRLPGRAHLWLQQPHLLRARRWPWAAASREDELEPILERVKEATQEHHLRLIWYTPTQYCEFDPDGHGAGHQGLHRSQVQHVRRAQRRRDPLPELLCRPWATS